MGHMLKNPKLAAAAHALGHTATGWAIATVLALLLVKVGLIFDLAVLLGAIAGGILVPVVQEGVVDLKFFSRPVGQDQLIDVTNYLPILGVAFILVGGPVNILAGIVVIGGAVAAEYSRGVYR